MNKLQSRVRRIEKSKEPEPCKQLFTVSLFGEPAPPITCECGGEHLYFEVVEVEENR
jgi:hypothetical protein